MVVAGFLKGIEMRWEITGYKWEIVFSIRPSCWKIVTIEMQCSNPQILQSQSPIPNTKYQVPNTKYQIPNSKFQIPNTEYRIPNTKYQIPNPKFPIPNSQSPIPKSQIHPFLSSQHVNNFLKEDFTLYLQENWKIGKFLNHDKSAN